MKNNNKKYVYKSFFAHQYEKEEAFLEKMAREGWQFVMLHYGIPSKYEFDRAEPVDYVYQLDYVDKDEDTEDYHQLFADAGWNEVYTWNGVYNGKWYYFRRLREPGRDQRIFTDADSKYRMYDKLWKRYGLFYLMLLMLQVNSFNHFIKNITEDRLFTVSGIINCIGFVLVLMILGFFFFVIGGILIKRNQMKTQLKRSL